MLVRVGKKGQEGHLRKLHPGTKRGGQRRTTQKRVWSRSSWLLLQIERRGDGVARSSSEDNENFPD